MSRSADTWTRISPLRRGRLLLLLALAAAAPLAAQQPAPAQLEQLRFRHIGPVGNRTIAVAGIPGDRRTYLVGAASGGIWKTTDAGLTWRPVFDAQDVHSVGALAIARSDPATVYAGTGETFIRSNVSIGDGVYKSTDGGETWTRIGLESTGRIGRIIVHPSNPDVVYVAALGHAYSPQQDRGIFRTTDGGRTWKRALFVDEHTGASDLIMDPSNPRVLFAGMWQLDLKTWRRESGGPGSGIYVSRDGGDTWQKLEGNGLPKLPAGKIALCTSPEAPRRIYAVIETGDGVPWHGQPTESGKLWRSDDGGGTWKLVSHNRSYGGRSAYYSRCAVAPDDPDEAYFLTASYIVTLDGGATSKAVSGRDEPGWDYHDLWIDPTDADRQAVAHDGGISISENRGRSWLKVQLPIAQMYHVTVDTKIPYNVFGNRQDGPSMAGPSNSRSSGGIPRGLWHSVGGGESGFATPDPVEPDVIWSSASGSGARGGIVVRYDERTRQFRQVEVWPESTGGWPAGGVKYRFQWTFPLLVSPHDHNTVYVTSQHVHRTRNGGQSWEVISPDLTTNDTSRMGISGGLTPDNIGVEYCCVIYAFEESPAQAGVLWAGTNDGLVHVSRDGGATWTNVTKNIPELPPLGTVRNIDASKWSAGKAYATVDFHEVGRFDPFVYRTEDFGRTWTKITRGIAGGPLSYARFVHEDPVRPGLLYLGTENALYVSFNDGADWRQLGGKRVAPGVAQGNGVAGASGGGYLPATPVYGLVVEPRFNDLVVGTYGRGFWILDDVTPLQQLTPSVATSPSHLFQPRPAYRFQPVTSEMAMPDDATAGENPPSGASLNYWLAAEAKGPVKIRISTPAGETVRTLDGTKTAGLNRVWWNLRHEPTAQLRLRTKPLYADWVDLGPERWRQAPDAGRFSMLAPPGTYVVTLEVDGQRHTRELRVLKDPNTAGSEADIAAQTALVREIVGDINAAADLVNRVEWTRRQLLDLRDVLKERGNAAAASAGEEVEKKLVQAEGELLQLRLTGTGQDGVRWPTMLVGRLSYLAGNVATGDFPPTDQQREVHALLRGRLQAAGQRIDGILQNDLAAFNRMLQESKVAPVVAQP